jgi:hypothetical protein
LLPSNLIQRVERWRWKWRGRGEGWQWQSKRVRGREGEACEWAFILLLGVGWECVWTLLTDFGSLIYRLSDFCFWHNTGN